MHSTVATPAYANARHSCSPKSVNALEKFAHSQLKSTRLLPRSTGTDRAILSSVTQRDEEEQVQAQEARERQEVRRPARLAQGPVVGIVGGHASTSDDRDEAIGHLLVELFGHLAEDP